MSIKEKINEYLNENNLQSLSPNDIKTGLLNSGEHKGKFVIKTMKFVKITKSGKAHYKVLGWDPDYDDKPMNHDLYAEYINGKINVTW